jgi:hypothetical protein
MVFCTYCGQSFTRDEHLERHILTRESLPSIVHSRLGGVRARVEQLELTIFLEQTPMSSHLNALLVI